MSCPHGNHPDGCERCAEIADHERAYELLFTENAKLRAEVERLAAQAAGAPAVRMLTEDELHMAWVSAGQSHTPARIADAVQREFCAVNAGKRIPPDGKIGGV